MNRLLLKRVLPWMLAVLLLLGGCGSENSIGQDPGQGISSTPKNGPENEPPNKTENENKVAEDQAKNKPADKTASEDLKFALPPAFTVVKEEGYYSIIPKDKKLNIMTTWNNNKFTIRAINEDTTFSWTIGEIIADEIKLQTVFEASSDLYGFKLEALADDKGILLTAKEEQTESFPTKLLWLNESGVQEVIENVQSFALSPHQKYAVIFPGTYQEEPLLRDLANNQAWELPQGVDKGWPVYQLGLSFSQAEDKLLYEDWSDNSLNIYDINERKNIIHLGEEGFTLLEASWSPQGDKITYLAQDVKQGQYFDGDGRDPLGNKLVLYDTTKKQVLKTINGNPYIYQRALWSPDGTKIVINMANSPKESDYYQLQGDLYEYDLANDELRKITSAQSGEWTKQALAWSSSGKQVAFSSLLENGRSEEWIIELDTGRERKLEPAKEYLQITYDSGTPVFKLIKLDNPVLAKFEEKQNMVVSPDERYVMFTVGEYGEQEIKIVPLD